MSSLKKMLALAPATAPHPLDGETMLKYFLAQLDVRSCTRLNSLLRLGLSSGEPS
jgi:hypothetical protein